VISATNKNLEEEIQKGNFREDLFYRLNVIPFFVPPLREHPEDIPLLANYFVSEFARAYGRRPKNIAEPSMEVLVRHRWPGNVRELKNLVERLVIMVPGDRIERRHLPPGICVHRAHTKPQAPPSAPTRSESPHSGASVAAGRPRSGGFSSLQEARCAYERDYILRKLEENQGNMSRTAEVLGLERSHLYRKMKSLGITWGE
jgi:two-component system, NtrC family, nitrogen regulation response regulator NtrX